MNFLNSMLGVVSSWQDVVDKATDSGNYDFGWVGSLLTTLSIVLWVLLAIVGAAGGIYAIYVGIKMARADSAEARDENKKRLINIIISIVVVVVLILFFNTFLPMILDAFDVFEKQPGTSSENPPEGGSQGASIQTIINTAKTFLHM